MKSAVEPLEGNKVKVSVEVDEVEFEKAVDAAFRKLAREVRINGFRPGKAPAKLLDDDPMLDPLNPPSQICTQRPGIDLFSCADRHGLGEHSSSFY